MSVIRDRVVEWSELAIHWKPHRSITFFSGWAAIAIPPRTDHPTRRAPTKVSLLPGRSAQSDRGWSVVVISATSMPLEPLDRVAESLVERDRLDIGKEPPESRLVGL